MNLWIQILSYGFILWTILNVTQAEIFTAMADIQVLLRAEKHVTSVIDQYIETEVRRLEKLKQFAEEYHAKNQQAIAYGIDYVGNPVNSYLLIKRLTSDWNFVESLMRNNMADVFLQNITSQRDMDMVRFPNDEDLKGAAVALMRIQDTYNLDTSEMASGTINGIKKSEKLEAHDCFELGRIAYNEGDYYHTLMWMQEALDVVRHEKPPTANEEDILEYLAFSMFQQGNVKHALQMTKRLKQLNPDHPRARGNIKYYEDVLIKEGLEVGDEEDSLPPVVNPRQDNGAVPERGEYEKACRGEYQMPETEKAKLYCYYKRNKPFLKLAPIKVEIVHWKPKIVIFRQAVSDREIEVIKEMAYPRLVRATVQNSQTGENEPATYRVSKSAWLKPIESEVIAAISRRQDDMTDLDMDTAEDLQIANYGIGGHYEPHYDFARKEETNAFKGLNTGNRIATILTYMSEPEAGGATVFTDHKLAVFPSKNDAVFWFNLLKNGEGDMTTRHAACPVLSGIKWVSNRWIHERGQEFRRPCGLDENEYE